MASLLLPIIYLAFISLGLPDALLGAAWPTMYPQLGAQVSWAGGVSTVSYTHLDVYKRQPLQHPVLSALLA